MKEHLQIELEKELKQLEIEIKALYSKGSNNESLNDKKRELQKQLREL